MCPSELYTAPKNFNGRSRDGVSPSALLFFFFSVVLISYTLRLTYVGLLGIPLARLFLLRNCFDEEQKAVSIPTFPAIAAVGIWGSLETKHLAVTTDPKRSLIAAKGSRNEEWKETTEEERGGGAKRGEAEIKDMRVGKRGH